MLGKWMASLAWKHRQRKNKTKLQNRGTSSSTCYEKNSSNQEDLLCFRDCSFLMMSTFTRISSSNLIDLLFVAFDLMIFTCAFFGDPTLSGPNINILKHLLFITVSLLQPIFYFVFSNHTKDLFTQSYLPDYKSRAVSPLGRKPRLATYFASLWYKKKKTKHISISFEDSKRRDICVGQAVCKFSQQLTQPWRDS